MSSIIPSNRIDDLELNKFFAKEKIKKIISFAKESNEKPMIKTASSNLDQNQLVNLFSNMLACLNLKTSDDNMQGLITKLQDKINNKENIIKSARYESKERKDEIKIASKRVRDSHYQIDISKDEVTKNGTKIFMVSCYTRDAYLGRYLIKRNYYFTADREKACDSAYDEILTKMASLKERYYNEIIDVAGISTQMRVILDGVISEIHYEEDSISSSIKR